MDSVGPMRRAADIGFGMALAPAKLFCRWRLNAADFRTLEPIAPASTSVIRSRPRLVFVINSLGSGGAERALATILEAGGDRVRRNDIYLILLDREPEMRALPGLAGKYVLDARGGLIKSALRLLAVLKELRPNLVVSFLVRSNFATAAVGPALGIPTIVCERMNLSSHLRGRYEGFRLRLLMLLPGLLYRHASRILAVSRGVRADLLETFGSPPNRTIYLPNGYDIEHIAAAGQQPPAVAIEGGYIVAVGRLVAAKGFAELIEAYDRARPPLPLVILGEGPEQEALERDIAARGLGDRIRLAGYLENPFAVVARAAFLVSASRNEGFPNAIAEAMALGRAVLVTDCPSGPAELLGATADTPGEVTEAPFGLIVPDGDIEAMAAGLRKLCDPALQATLGAAARGRMEDFRADVIAGRYWSLFDEYVRKPDTRGTRDR